MNLRAFSYVTNRDMNVYSDDMTLKEYASQGKDSSGINCTPLIAAVREEHFQVVQYLLEEQRADPTPPLSRECFASCSMLGEHNEY